MRLFVAIGLLAAIAASVLLGLATFGVPVNDSFWLLRVQAPLLDAKLGALGYRVNGHDSRVGVGYHVPDEVGDLSRSVRDFVHTLTLVLVLFPVSFALACLTALASMVAMIHVRAMSILAAGLAVLGALVATVAFAILICLYYELQHNVPTDELDLTYGQAFVFTVVSAACLYGSAITLALGACCAMRMPRRERSDAVPERMPPAKVSYTRDPSAQPYERAERVHYASALAPVAGDLPKFPEPDVNESYMEDAPTAGEPTPYDESHELDTWAAHASRVHLLDDSEWHTARHSHYTGDATHDEYAPTMPLMSRQQADAWFLPTHT